ncbi:MAG: 30S ribosomal protein S12 methylthiotransferase RimO [Oscillospiraceae bacterium]|nr:30S ribosomal protein S12 methylthiotransferase RimO [Oscillospiraceae bacterium]
MAKNKNKKIRQGTRQGDGSSVLFLSKTEEPSPCLVGVISLGCSKNRVNTEQMMYLLSSAGYIVTGETDGADIVLINTCGFIESAKKEAYETIQEFSEAKKEGKIGKFIVAGCLPERYKNNISEELPEVDAFIGTGSFDDIATVADAITARQGRQGDGSSVLQNNISEEPSPCLPCLAFADINSPVSETPRIISTSSVWAYLKIAEGCDNKCAYCAIPGIRGKFRSRPLENIIAEAKKLVSNGFIELIIVAQDVTMYGLDIYGERRLPALLSELTKITDLKWIRLHYLYPDGFNDELIDVIAKSDKILKYLDIPIQHINNTVLTGMRRRGTGKKIKELIKSLRERIPGVILRTSLITGLPFENENEFEELCGFIRETKFEHAGVFPYSPEEGTDAALMEHVSGDIAEERAEKLLKLQSDIMLEWKTSRLGTITDVIVEDMLVEIDGIEYNLARSYAESSEIDGYILLQARSFESRFNSSENKAKVLSPCRITGIQSGELIGELL